MNSNFSLLYLQYQFHFGRIAMYGASMEGIEVFGVCFTRTEKSDLAAFLSPSYVCIILAGVAFDSYYRTVCTHCVLIYKLHKEIHASY